MKSASGWKLHADFIGLGFIVVASLKVPQN